MVSMVARPLIARRAKGATPLFPPDQLINSMEVFDGLVPGTDDKPAMQLLIQAGTFLLV